MDIIAERTQPNLDGIHAALTSFRDAGHAIEAVPRTAGIIAIELTKLLIEKPVIKELPRPCMISGDVLSYEQEANTVMLLPGGRTPVVMPDTRFALTIALGPLPLLQYSPEDDKWVISTRGLTASLPVDDWLDQKIATVEQTNDDGDGVTVKNVSARKLISVARNTMAHAEPNADIMKLHKQFRVFESGQEGTSYPFLFCIALGAALCGYTGEQSGRAVSFKFKWQLSHLESAFDPSGPSSEDRLVIKAHYSVPWIEGASMADNGPRAFL